MICERQHLADGVAVDAALPPIFPGDVKTAGSAPTFS
jgi:hypothetical protein